MPHKDILCGIYVISTPKGSKYVGSSHNIYRRWSEHKYHLRRGTHHSLRLQLAWNKYKEQLNFEVFLLCESSDLNREEQRVIHELGAKLNTTEYVNNVWTNVDTRKKIMDAYKDPNWIANRKAIAKKVAEKRGIKVDCSNGTSYPNLHEAARAFGVNPSRIAHLIKTQRVGNLGVRFKRASDDWVNVISAVEQRNLTKQKNGTSKHSEDSRKKMSESAKKRIKFRDPLTGQFTKQKVAA